MTSSQSLTDAQWITVFNAMVSKGEEDVLLALTHTTGQWPSRSHFIQWLESRSWAETLSFPQPVDRRDADDQKKALDPSPTPVDAAVVRREEKRIERSQWWQEAIAHYGLDLVSVQDASPALLSYWVREEMDGALIAASASMSEEDMYAWMSIKTDYPVVDSGHDKSNNIGWLVMSAREKTLDHFSEKAPRWVNVLDSKERTPLFYARSKAMVHFLMGKNADPNDINKDNQTPSLFWSEVVKSPMVPRWIEALGVSQVEASLTGRDLVKDSMVFKWFSLSPGMFTEKEKELWEKADQSPKEWSWTGRLSGVERTWTMPEIWRFGEAMLALSEMPAPLGFDLGYNYSGHTNLVYKSQNLLGLMKKLRADIPQGQLSGHISSLPESMTESIAHWLMEVRQASPSPISLAIDQSKQGEISYNVLPSVMQKNSIDFFKRLSPAQSQEWLNQMVNFWQAPWVFSQKTNTKMAAVISLSTRPIQLGGLAAPELSRPWSEYRQDEGIRTADFGKIWEAEFSKNFSSLWQQSQQQKMPLDAWAAVLRIGLCVMGTKDMKAYTKTAQNLKFLVDSGVPMERVPWRWAKNYGNELKSCVDKWVIRQEIDKPTRKNKKRLEEEDVAVTPRRRM